MMPLSLRQLLAIILILLIGAGIGFTVSSAHSSTLRLRGDGVDIGQVNVGKDRWDLQFVNLHRSFSQLEIESDRDPLWRDVTSAIDELLERDIWFESVQVSHANCEVSLRFPSRHELQGHDYGRWWFSEIPLMGAVKMPLLPSYEDSSDFISIGVLSSTGSMTAGFTDRPIERPRENKVSYLILFVDRGIRLSTLSAKVSELKSNGYNTVLLAEGSAPLRWPPHVMPRSLAELPLGD